MWVPFSHHAVLLDSMLFFWFRPADVSPVCRFLNPCECGISSSHVFLVSHKMQIFHVKTATVDICLWADVPAGHSYPHCHVDSLLWVSGINTSWTVSQCATVRNTCWCWNLLPHVHFSLIQTSPFYDSSQIMEVGEDTGGAHIWTAQWSSVSFRAPNSSYTSSKSSWTVNRLR